MTGSPVTFFVGAAIFYTIFGPGRALRGDTGATSGVHGWWGKAKELGSQ